MDLLLCLIAWLLTLALAAIFWLFGKELHLDVIEEMPVFFIVVIVGFPFIAGNLRRTCPVHLRRNLQPVGLA